MHSLRDELLREMSERYSCEPEYLFEGDDRTAVFRRRDNRKWFAILMTIPADRLGLPGGGTVDLMNVKGDPLFISALHTQPGFYPAWHMNKLHWLTVLLDGTVPAEQILPLTEMSYTMTAPAVKRPKHKEE